MTVSNSEVKHRQDGRVPGSSAISYGVPAKKTVGKVLPKKQGSLRIN